MKFCIMTCLGLFLVMSHLVHVYGMFVQVGKDLDQSLQDYENEVPLAHENLQERIVEVDDLVHMYARSKGLKLVSEDQESDNEQQTPIHNNTPRTPKRARDPEEQQSRKEDHARDSILRSIRKTLKTANGYTNDGKGLVRSIMLASCGFGSEAVKVSKSAVARLLGVHHRKVDTGVELHASYMQGVKNFGTNVWVPRKNGRALSEETRRAVKTFYLDPSNTRVSPNKSDQRLLTNDIGEKVLTSRHWLMTDLMTLFKRFRIAVITLPPRGV